MSQPRFSDRPFKYVGGDPSLDFVNTVDWTSAGLRNDRLESYVRLLAWARGTGVVSERAALRLRRIAARQSERAARALREAWQVRRVLKELFDGAAAGQLPRKTLDGLNQLLAQAARRLMVAPSPNVAATRLTWQWRGAGEELDAPLWPVVWSAADLLRSDEAGRIRVCAGEACGWVYVDRSRNGLRRWCEMETCGTLAKGRRRRARAARLLWRGTGDEQHTA
jgi:predicted RNA-binding Zn ribbon-like protein